MIESEVPALQLDSKDPLAPRAPWTFLIQAIPGGFSGPGLGLMASWAAFFLCTNTFWALHLKALAGWSFLPNYWGELLTFRDLWELAENGGLKDHLTGPVLPVAAALGCLWFLWAGWRVQTTRVGLPPRLGAWAWGFLDAVLIAALPMFLVSHLLVSFFNLLGATGIQSFCWLEYVGGTLVRLACLSAFFLQWWLCRLGRAGHAGQGWRLGSWPSLGTHLAQQFLGLWRHPVQWTVLVLGGVVVRIGLTLLVLVLAWRMGGGTALRVWCFLLLELVAVLANAWLLGWFLRVSALFGHHDAAVKGEIRRLEASVAAGTHL